MLRALFALVVALTLLPASPALAEAPPQVSYQHTIQPLFERKCVACHACYEAPCQLNLGSSEGLQRGATQALLYDGTRTRGIPPTRLFTDARSVAEWRSKGFFSVLGNSPSEAQIGLLAQMLDLGRQSGLKPNARLPDSMVTGTARQTSCPADQRELSDYARHHPQEGMPLAVTGLTDSEYASVKQWLAQGAPIDSRPAQATPAEARAIRQWEDLLNQPSIPGRLVGRWLYEHLFLAHLYFSDLPTGHFFELVRSRSPSGRPVDLIATTRPNDPADGLFYYRLRPIQGSIVFKTHITFALNPDKLARTRRQFFATGWTADSLPAYGEAERSNPFLTFAAIPATARYQFMLDNAEYFVRTFIRGPVCHGQIATDVIRDQFWTVFQDPAHDLYLTDAQFRQQADPLLGIPGEKDHLLELAPEWIRYRDRRNQYERLRAAAYARSEPQGAGFADIWAGDGYNDNALLSIFRHFDSAAVRKGLIGDIPQTLWMLDYPLFERTYYDLVANFNVFGSVSHQAQTRLYFDLIRNSAETNFLRLLPPDARRRELADWYQGSGWLKVDIAYEKADLVSPSADAYGTRDPKRELAQRLLQRLHGINAAPDPINRCYGGHYCYHPDSPAFVRDTEQTLSRLASRTASQLPVINSLPEMTVLRIYNSNGQREVYSLLRNRAHSNVAFMLGESLRYQPEKDTLTVFPGILGGYPNFVFNIPASEVAAFTDAMQSVDKPEDLTAIVDRWGVRRTHPAFWDIWGDLTARMRETDPIEAGILDMGRYENL